MRVAVLFGGKSGEHTVSCISAASVLDNIHTEKYSILKIGITGEGEWYLTEATSAQIRSGEWETLSKKKAVLSPDTAHHGFLLWEEDGIKHLPVDVIFPVMHGDYCEDGCLQGLCELAGIPYVGCGVCASAVGMDKEVAKTVFSAAGIPVAKGISVEKKDAHTVAARIKEDFSYPVFIKPANAGSSLGASKVVSPEELGTALDEAFRYDTKVLVEEYIEAREIECAVLGNEDPQASVLGEIVPSASFYDYDAKYVDGTSELLIPAPLTEEESRQIREYAVRAFRAVGAKGLSRVDFFKDKKTGRVVINEINTLPGFTDISMYPKLWQATGVPYSDLIDRLIAFAVRT
ncbi:MAG: D-alanine--D-alanine ligase [Ruminococcaceae bacterium]|nr:D-alanine--D-alanine ligase [Oscillospiraceae bacterium]